MGDYTNSGANIILTNTTLNIDSWFSLSRGSGGFGWIYNASFYNSTMSCGNFSLGYQNARTPNLAYENLLVTNSTIHDGGAFYVAESPGSVGVVRLTGNTVLDMGLVNPMLMALSVGATGTVFVANNSIVTNHDWLSCGANGWGELVLQDNAYYGEYSDFNFGDYGGVGTTGILIITNNAQVVMLGSGSGVYVGKTAGSVGTVYQSGNSVINACSAGVWQLAQASGSTGTWYQNGGTNYAGGWVSIGRGGDPSSQGLMIVSGGLFDQVSTGNGLIVGEQGYGIMVVTNNGVVISEAQNIGLSIGWNAGIGELDLGGCLLVGNFIQQGTGSGTFVFNGGTLRVGANAQLNFMTNNLSAAYVYHTSTIDSAGKNISIQQNLQDGGYSGGITKIGNDTLLLDGANTYTGPTTVSAGTLGGIGSIAGPVSVNSSATLAPGDQAMGTLTLGSTLNLAAGSTTLIYLNATAGTSSQISGATTVTLGGTLVLQNTHGKLLANQAFQVFPVGTISGNFSSVVSHTPGQNVNWDLSQLAPGGNGTVKVAAVTAAPVTLSPVVSGGDVTISWPSTQSRIDKSSFDGRVPS